MTADTRTYDLAVEARRVVDVARFVTRATDNEAAWSQVGSISDYLAEIVARNTPAPDPPSPTPTPSTTLLGFAISYAGHDPARDVYLGFTPEQMEWGIHWGIDLLAPAPGRVEAYQFATPLLFAGSPEGQTQRDNWARLFAGGPPCCPPHETIAASGVHTVTAQQNMSIAVFWPDQSLYNLKALWFGHVRPDIAVGRVEAGQRICTSWNSGIDFEARGIQARASHVHCCGSTTGTLSPNGDADGLLAAGAMGWKVDWRGAGGPGPNDYLGGQWVAGKPRSAWAGHSIPPPPA